MTQSALETTIEEMKGIELGVQLPLNVWYAMYKAFGDAISAVDKIENGTIFREKRENMQQLRKASSQFRGMLLSSLNRAADHTNKDKVALMNEQHKLNMEKQP